MLGTAVMNKETLNDALDALESGLPRLIEDHPDPSSFWPAFTKEADDIEERAGEHASMVLQRLQAMLEAHGRMLVLRNPELGE